ncbi:MAG TPA: hypothetical protein VJI98_02535 [Candidatus Nanoarchaeia archaeon]|nr:hypothetical protein [Candidatus Nanoarchaeia archaeon]
MVQIYHLLYSPKLNRLFGLTDAEGKIDWDYDCSQVSGGWHSAQQQEITTLVDDPTIAVPMRVFVIESASGNGVYKTANIFLSRPLPDADGYANVIPIDVSPNSGTELIVKPYRMALEDFCRGSYDHASREDRFIVANSKLGPRFRAEFHRIFGTFAAKVHR